MIGVSTANNKIFPSNFSWVLLVFLSVTLFSCYLTLMDWKASYLILWQFIYSSPPIQFWVLSFPRPAQWISTLFYWIFIFSYVHWGLWSNTAYHHRPGTNNGNHSSSVHTTFHTICLLPEKWLDINTIARIRWVKDNSFS